MTEKFIQMIKCSVQRRVLLPVKSSSQIAYKDRQEILASELGGERKNICEGLEYVQGKNLKGKGRRILGMIYRKAYQRTMTVSKPSHLLHLHHVSHAHHTYCECLWIIVDVCDQASRGR